MIYLHTGFYSDRNTVVYFLGGGGVIDKGQIYWYNGLFSPLLSQGGYEPLSGGKVLCSVIHPFLHEFAFYSAQKPLTSSL